MDAVPGYIILLDTTLDIANQQFIVVILNSAKKHHYSVIATSISESPGSCPLTLDFQCHNPLVASFTTNHNIATPIHSQCFVKYRRHSTIDSFTSIILQSWELGQSFRQLAELLLCHLRCQMDCIHCPH